MPKLETKKPWWQSKTIITSLGVAGVAMSTIATNPPQTKMGWIQTGVLIGGPLLAGIFRKSAVDRI